MSVVSRFKIMPFLVLLAAVSFGVRFVDFINGVSSDSSLVSVAVAEESIEVEEEETTTTETESPNNEGLIDPATAFGEESESIALPHADAEEESSEWRDSFDSDFDYSDIKMKLFEDLTERRKVLEKQERELSMREALLTAAEQELESKYKELTSLKVEMEELLGVQSEEESKRVVSLVKIYEGMKPKQAARIFNTLDMDVLLQVVSKMSERKSAPVLASMNPERARQVTIQLMEQKSLPQLSDDIIQQ